MALLKGIMLWIPYQRSASPHLSGMTSGRHPSKIFTTLDKRNTGSGEEFGTCASSSRGRSLSVSWDRWHIQSARAILRDSAHTFPQDEVVNFSDVIPAMNSLSGANSDPCFLKEGAP